MSLTSFSRRLKLIFKWTYSSFDDVKINSNCYRCEFIDGSKGRFQNQEFNLNSDGPWITDSLMIGFNSCSPFWTFFVRFSGFITKPSMWSLVKFSEFFFDEVKFRFIYNWILSVKIKTGRSKSNSNRIHLTVATSLFRWSAKFRSTFKMLLHQNRP